MKSLAGSQHKASSDLHLKSNRQVSGSMGASRSAHPAKRNFILQTLNLTYQTRSERRCLVKELKILWAVHHMLNVSGRAQDIAEAVGVKLETLNKWVDTPQWQEALDFWGYPTCFRRPWASRTEELIFYIQRAEFNHVARLWRRMIRNGEHLKPPPETQTDEPLPNRYRRPPKRGVKAHIQRAVSFFSNFNR